MPNLGLASGQADAGPEAGAPGHLPRRCSALRVLHWFLPISTRFNRFQPISTYFF